MSPITDDTKKLSRKIKKRLLMNPDRRTIALRVRGERIEKK